MSDFYARFDRLAKGGPSAAIRAPVNQAVAVSADVDTDSRVSSYGPPCPVDFSHVSLQRLSDIANRLQYMGKDGCIAFDKMHHILEDLGVPISRRNQTYVKKWLGESQMDKLYYWPPLLAFTVSIDRMTITADKHTRSAYPRLQLQVSFCGEVVKFPPFSWNVGVMQPFEPKKMTVIDQMGVVKKMTRNDGQYNARFNLDGP